MRPVYLLLGEDASSQDAVLAGIKEAFGSDPFNYSEFDAAATASSASAVVAEASTLPVMGERRVVVVKNPRLPQAAREALAAYLQDPLPSTTLVLLSEERKPDLKDPLVRLAASKGGVCVFGPLSEEAARGRLRAAAGQAGKNLADDAAQALVAEAGTDWGVLSQELQKAILFTGAAPEISREAILQCLGYRKAADPFALTRLVQGRRLKACLAQFRALLRDGRSDDQSFRALAQISGAVSKQLRAKVMIAAGQGPEAVFRALRLYAYWDRDFLEQVARWPLERLEKDLRLCVETEARLKSRSWLEPRLEVEQLLAALCRP